MLNLSVQEIDIIATSVLQDFSVNDETSARAPVNINWLARSYLGLDVQYAKLSDDGETLGVTAYKNTILELPLRDGNEEICVPVDTILLDNSLKSPGNVHRLRFTLAHEAAHQILARIEERQAGYSFRRVFVPGKRYTCGEIKAAEYLWERQANTLGAALLMPKSMITPHTSIERRLFILTAFGVQFDTMEYKSIKALANRFNVSLSAMRKRLHDLGFITYTPGAVNRHPLEVCVSNIIV